MELWNREMFVTIIVIVYHRLSSVVLLQYFSSYIQLLEHTAAAAGSCDTDRTSIKAYLADQTTVQISRLQHKNLFVVVVSQKRVSNS